MKSFVTGQMSIGQPTPIVIAVTGSVSGITRGHLPGGTQAVQIVLDSPVLAGDGGHASG
jgi:hypothetical protein